jgi:hypothetical protein
MGDRAADGAGVREFRRYARTIAARSGEKGIIDGRVTCPWHGYEYRLADGCAPPPFTEKLATYPVRIMRGFVEVDPRPLPPGTPAPITWAMEP